MMIEKKRIFVAIKFTPNEDYISNYEYLKRRLRMDMISWIEPDSAHLTLKFFGNTPIERIDEIKSALSKAVKDVENFNLSIDKFGVFGSRHSPQVIWAGINNSEKLIPFYHSLMTFLKPIGYLPDPGNFVPHITLGRVKKMTDKQWFWETLDSLQNKEVQSITVDKIILYESVLLKKGAKHLILMEFPFKKV